MFPAHKSFGGASVPASRASFAPIAPHHLATLQQAAAADNHVVVHPTHVAVRPDGQIIGYASLGAVPLFFAWMDSRHATARESFTLWQLAEEELRRQGHAQVCMPCTDVSPFHPFLARRGYTDLGQSNFTLKTLNPEDGRLKMEDGRTGRPSSILHPRSSESK